MSTDSPATEYCYGVAHINGGELGRYQPHINRDEAERDLRNCLRDGAYCYLVRRPLPPMWERVPDGQ